MSTPEQPPAPTYESPAPQKSGIAVPILFGAVIALIGSNVYLFTEVSKTRGELTHTNEKIADELSKMREASSVTVSTHRKNLDAMRDELDAARRQASMLAGQAKVDAEKHAEQLAQRLENEQRKANEQVKRIGSEVTEVKQTATAATTRIGEVSNEVGVVKSDVASTKSELDKTIASLRRASGDIDSHSSLIATNSKELAALRQLGERNFFEFRISKSKQFTKVGDITIQLKKTDEKKNKFTIEVVADDKKVEKKDKNINEPVQFYVPSKARQPWEIVVNEVHKDQIVGYLSTPKVQNAR